MPGMVCAQLGVGTVVLTDYVDGVLRNTQKNVDANNCEGRAVVAMLDWLKPETAAAFCSPTSDDDGSAGDMLPVAGFDTVIAADVIYDEWHAEAVPKMCVRFLRRLPADVMAQHPDAIRCLVVLGDRTCNTILAHVSVHENVDVQTSPEWTVLRTEILGGSQIL